ncbi:hypothetical protein QJS10_CPB17g00181 [Acorus calamus]|uniref:J domain-containing protein n=1 Tax=Acorus calamus TaxID=4465 RepID=A0AAV9CZK8_ACOCL|nr:hypothetical protein QJS10_CPB17g00181 [Acorus calamus]
MAMSMGLGYPSSVMGGGVGSLLKGGKKKRRVCRGTVLAGLTNQYRTLQLQPGASEKEVKKAFRQLALQYHPDVCKGSNCGVQFHRINEAYDILISKLREAEEEQAAQSNEWYDENETMRGMCDSSWDMWEEWMGWEGAGIRDYTSHINPYI